MGSVWLARHDGLGDDVAVKMMSPELGGREGSAGARMRKEATLSARLASRHAVRALEHGELDDGRPYLVMELLRGETLGAYLAREERMPSADVLRLCSQLAEVLDEAHALGIVHRDIKPDNVFLEAGHDALFAKVLDFGIAKETRLARVSDVTSPGAIVGTPEFMSPEQLLSSRSVGPSCDRWALAVVVYRALVGRLPFTGETLPSLSLAICQADHDPPSEVAGYNAALDGWFARAFAVAPGTRFPDAAAMVSSLAECLEAREPIDATTTPGPRASSREDRTAPRTSRPSVTMSGAATEPRDGERERPWSRARLAWVTAAAALGLALVTNLAWHGTLPVHAPGRPLALPGEDEPWSDPTATHEDARLPALARPDEPTAGANEARGPSTAKNPQSTSPTGAVPTGVSPTSTWPSGEAKSRASLGRAPQGRERELTTSPATTQAATASSAPAPASKAKPGCENPFELDREGDLVPKPGCM